MDEFDPFGDFQTAGYLRNTRKDKDPAIVKHQEHSVFRANLDDAMSFLEHKNALAYSDFLEVHRILFSDYYPWAGQDRSITLPNESVVKGPTRFCCPEEIKKVVSVALNIGQSEQMNARPGRVMGLFAFGHPFLDGNGRTMFLVHMELTYRAGFSINWGRTTKEEYLSTIDAEIATPNNGILDRYLSSFIVDRLNRDEWVGTILSLKGLDGLDEGIHIDGLLTDPVIAEKYRKFEEKREFKYETAPLVESKICGRCHKKECECGNSGGGRPPVKPKTPGMG